MDLSDRLSASDLSPERLRTLPRRPGVYLMRDRAGQVIYVGKAKELRARIRQYFSGHDERYSVPFLMDRIASIETIVTEDERQAIVLEGDLIRQYKPRYNIRLKDDKAYLLVRINRNADFPRLELVRAEREDGAEYLGPFAFGYELRSLLETIKRTVPLRTCTDHVLRNRIRPCIEYQIKRCSGPCCLPVSVEVYDEWLDQAARILQGRDREVISALEEEMHRASAELRFEDAALIRDRLSVLKRVNEDGTQVRFGDQSQHAFGLYREGTRVEISVLLVRRGRLFESQTFGFEDVVGGDDEVIDAVLSQFYGQHSEGVRDIPETILVPVVLEDRESHEQLLAERRGSSVTISVPKAGVKARLLELACTNAQENFRVRFREDDSGDRACTALAAALELPEVPQTVECVDISHLQGSSTVASVVRFRNGKPERDQYRHFILSVDRNDDFAGMREVLRRHLSRGAEENTLADLLVVDGGPPQLAQAEIVQRELSLSQPIIISLAKKRSERTSYRESREHLKRIREMKPERVYLRSDQKPVILDPQSEALHVLERIRDEAHRFAITFHRSRRAKRLLRSPLENIPGIGPKRRRELLKAFGSVRELRKASAEEISERCGIPIALGRRLAQKLAETGGPEPSSAGMSGVSEGVDTGSNGNGEPDGEAGGEKAGLSHRRKRRR